MISIIFKKSRHFYLTKQKLKNEETKMTNKFETF